MHISIINKKIFSAAFLSASILSACPIPALSQGEMVLEEVIVTSQKREQGQQDVPIAVAAFTGEMVEKAGAFNITGINGIKPNIILQTEGLVPNVPMFSIRGMNHSDPDPNSDPKISTVIDGVYTPFVAGALLDLFDIERIEVLRGPQGTLFGKNNLAGTVNVVSSRPTGEFGGGVKVAVGENGLQHYRAKVNTPTFANDSMSAKLAASKRVYDGYTTNITTGSDLNETDVEAFRGALKYAPDGSTFDATLIVDYTKDETIGPAGHSLGIPEIANDVYASAQSFDPTIDTESTGITLEANWDVNDGAITLVAARRDIEYLNRGDFDALPNDPGLDVTRDMEGDFESVELRYSSPLEGNFDYVAGLYYIQDEWQQENTVLVNPAVSTFGINSQEGSSLAGFFQGNIRLSDNFTLTLGGRYTQDDKEYSLLSQTFVGGNMASEFLADFDDDWSNFSPRVATEYRIDDNIMLYASVSEGYKGGGYNSRGTLPENIGPYDEETVLAYEIGLKSDLMAGSLRLNAAVFLNEFEGLQSSVTRQGSVRTENITTNIAEAETSGIELEITWLATEDLQLGLNLAYLHSEFTEFCDDANGPSPVAVESDCGGPITPVIVNGETQFLVAEDLTHLDLANAPQVSASLLVDYDIPVGFGYFTVHSDWRYSDEYNTWGRDNDPGFVRDSVTLWNANISFQDQDERYKISVYGRNLSDEEVMSGAIRTGTNPLIQFYQPPREIGIEAEYNF